MLPALAANSTAVNSRGAMAALRLTTTWRTAGSVARPNPFFRGPLFAARTLNAMR